MINAISLRHSSYHMCYPWPLSAFGGRPMPLIWLTLILRKPRPTNITPMLAQQQFAIGYQTYVN
jgi:hypothetical protein